MFTTVLPALSSASSTSPATAGYKVDISRGERIGRASSEWFSRPDDQRFLLLGSLHEAVRARADRALPGPSKPKRCALMRATTTPNVLILIVLGQYRPMAPTHWSYGQLCSLVGAPASYMRQLPAPLACINLQHGLLSHCAELVKTLESDDGYIDALVHSWRLRVTEPTPNYVELQTTIHFSFLRGASSPEELFVTAARMGMPALGIVDRNTVAAIVCAWDGEKTTGVR